MQFREILRILAAAEAEFIVIGGVGAVLHGAPIQTRDLDIVHGRSLGDLDLLGTACGLDHDDLLPHSEVIELYEGVRIRVLDLERIIELKEMAGRAKDLSHLPILRQTLEEQRKRDLPGPQ